MNLTNSLPDMGQGAKALKVTFCFDNDQEARIKHAPNMFLQNEAHHRREPRAWKINGQMTAHFQL
jgi:hypothetical protein